MTLSISPINIDPALPVAPDVGLLTTQSLEGTGIFDILMRTVKLHMAEEYATNRITGKEYSTVYLGTMSAVLQASVAYLVNNTQIDKLNAEIGLIRQQTVTELTQTDNEIPLGLGFNSDTLVEGLVANQKALSASQIAKTDKEMELADQQIVTELAQTDDHIPEGIGHNSSTTITGVLGSVKAKNDADIKLTSQKTATELANVVDVLPVGVSLSPTTTITGLIKNQKDLTAAQISKTAVEADLIEQQVVTELAQTADEIPIDLGHNINDIVAGMIGSTKAKTDAEIKLTNQKTATEIAQVVDVLPAGISNSPTLAITGLIKNQKDLAASQIKKTDGEVLLLGQKTITELAQTDSVLPTKVTDPGNTNPWLNSSSSIGGTQAVQNALLTAQKDGFKRDAEQKAAKIMVDSWVAQRTTDEAIQANTTNHLHETDIGAVIVKLKQGIDAV